MVSREEVRFGIVPGLAGLAEKLSAAFAHSRNREFDFEIAKLNSRDKTRKADAAALLEKQKADAAAEKLRRDNLDKKANRADQLRKQAEAFNPVVGTSNNPSLDELNKYPKLGSKDQTEVSHAQQKLQDERFLNTFTKRAIENGNAQGLSAATALQGSEFSLPGDGTLTLGDDASIQENMNFSSRFNQPELSTESTAVGAALSAADLSHLTPEQQASIQAKAQGASEFATPKTFTPQDLPGQLEQYNNLLEAREIMSMPVGDYFKKAVGRNMTDEEQFTIEEIMKAGSTHAKKELSDGQTPEEQRQDKADQTIADALLRKEFAAKLKGGASTYQALDAGKPGDGDKARWAYLGDDLGVMVTDKVKNLLNSAKSAIAKNNSYTPRQKEFYAQAKALTEGTPMPDAFLIALMKSPNKGTAIALLERAVRGDIKGALAQDSMQKIDRGIKAKLFMIYQDQSLEHSDGRFAGEEQQNLALYKALGFADAANALRMQQEAAMADQQMQAQDTALQAHNNRQAALPQQAEPDINALRRRIFAPNAY